MGERKDYERAKSLASRLRVVLYNSQVLVITTSDNSIALRLLLGTLGVLDIPVDLALARRILDTAKESFNDWATRTEQEIDDAESDSQE